MDYHINNYSTLHTNVKFKAIFKISIIKFLIIHVVIDFNGNHHKKVGWIVKRLWIHNGLLKSQHYACRTWKMKIVDSKNTSKLCQKIKNKSSQIKNWLMKCIDIFLIYIFLIFRNFKWHDCYKFYPWESISH